MLKFFQAIGGFVFNGDVTIRSSIMDLLRQWNSHSKYSGPTHDYQFLQFLLLEVFGTQAMATNELPRPKMAFVEDLFRIRVKGDSTRMGKFETMVARKCAECKKKQQI